MTPVDNLSYNEAVAELDGILAGLRGDNCDLDKVVALTARAVELINHCRARLTATDAELQEVLRSLNPS